MKTKKTPKFVETENKLVVARGGVGAVGKMGEGDQKVQASNNKINKS